MLCRWCAVADVLSLSCCLSRDVVVVRMRRTQPARSWSLRRDWMSLCYSGMMNWRILVLILNRRPHDPDRSVIITAPCPNNTTVHYNTLCTATEYYMEHYPTIQCITLPYALHATTLYYPTLDYTGLYYTILHYGIPGCLAWKRAVVH